MNKSRILLILLVISLVLPLVSATQTAEIVSVEKIMIKQNEIFDLKVNCFAEDNARCANTTACYLTLFDPDGGAVVDGSEMTYNNYYYNYTLNQSQTATLGNHGATVNCYDSVVSDGSYSKFSIIISQTGSQSDTISNSIILGVLLVVAIVLIYFAVTLKDTPLKMLLMFISLFLILISTNFMQLMIVDSGLLQNAQTAYTVVFWMIIIVMAYFFVKFLLEVISSLKIKNEIRQQGGST